MNDHDDHEEEIPAEVLVAWPNCAVPDCPNKACLMLNSARCYAHTTGSMLGQPNREEPS